MIVRRVLEADNGKENRIDQNPREVVIGVGCAAGRDLRPDLIPEYERVGVRAKRLHLNHLIKTERQLCLGDFDTFLGRARCEGESHSRCAVQFGALNGIFEPVRRWFGKGVP